MYRFLVTSIALIVLGSGCGADRSETSSPAKAARPQAATAEAPPPLAATAREAVDLFIEGQRKGSLAHVKAVLHPADASFKLPGPVAIDSYMIQAARVLDAEQAAMESMDGPRRLAGDVMIDVKENYPDGRTKAVTYYVREFDGVWKIYGWGYWLDEPT